MKKKVKYIFLLLIVFILIKVLFFDKIISFNHPISKEFLMGKEYTSINIINPLSKREFNTKIHNYLSNDWDKVKCSQTAKLYLKEQQAKTLKWDIIDIKNEDNEIMIFVKFKNPKNYNFNVLFVANKNREIIELAM